VGIAGHPKAYDLSCDFLKLLTSWRPTVSNDCVRGAVGVCAGAGEGTSLLFCEGVSQFCLSLVGAIVATVICAVVASGHGGSAEYDGGAVSSVC
jgi:hypothetical protein